MMDHARHLSSPSPTSPFLFHHSERSFKSNPLTPLLSSTADVTSVDDCFSTSSPNISHQSHNPFGVDHQHHHSLVDNHHHHHQQNHRHHNDQCVIDQDSLTGVDDDDGMHNMLSGSSTSSTSTMPLLTESHSHHTFSRISLEEYSPLSLVEDCDNALPISPTSLACGSHHSFKSSLSGLKMDNLVGGVGVNDHEVHDDVNDARSLSPSLLSGSSNNHHNLWSTSNTAITQNTSLLNSSSTSFLLSHHHHHHHQHQLNSLIQQLEPQSLDESPPLVSNSTSFESNSAVTNRPSSEPPPGCVLGMPDLESKSLNGQPHQSKLKQSNSKAGKAAPPAATRSRKSRSRPGAKQAKEAANKVCDKKTASSSVDNRQPVHCSKLHLQLNHHKKLQELQQRLFGTPSQQNETHASTLENKDLETVNASTSSTSGITEIVVSIKDEPDSSAGNKDDAATSTEATTNKSTRTRPIRTRRSRRGKSDTTCEPLTSSSDPVGSRSAQSTVTTETAEPDTTTRNSDCIKLADLLSNTDTKSNQSFIVNGFSAASETNDSDHSEKRVQQIQLQVNPSLTVVSSDGHNQQQPTGGQAFITSGVPNFTNQILCRPQAVVTTPGGQLKGLVSNQELLKSGETVLSNWSLQTSNSSGNQTSGATISNGQTIGAHQIAIQVICQDGTSLVLPVSSATGLNTAVSLTSQHQQLHAVLANNANQQRNSNQLIPLMSVSNIVAQQQVNSNDNSGSNSLNASSQANSTGAAQASGLAASSPTLAALLDAGSNRSNNEFNNNNQIGNFSGTNFVSTNLLRKLVSGNTAELKKGEITLQGSTISLANCGSLVTVCGPANNSTAQATNKSSAANVANGNNSGEKRIKLESNDIQATFTLIDPHGLIVSNGNEKTGKQAVANSTANNSNQTSSPASGAQQKSSSSATKEASSNSKQNKMGSSTGNRQVDPTQPFRCEHCNSTFTRLGNFTRHKKIHTVPTKDGQRFKCDVCSKSFLQRCDLARHLHIHRGTEPHRCNICGKGYIRHSDLVTHQRFHNKEKPFGCPHCSKGFCQRGDLNRHLRSIHLQMKPILCPCCNRKFAKQETLLRHLNTAHRSKPGTAGTPNTAVAELAPNYALGHGGNDKSAGISVVANATVINNNTQKNAPVNSLQAIQATLCKVSHSPVEPSTVSVMKEATSPSQQQSTNTKAISS